MSRDIRPEAMATARELIDFYGQLSEGPDVDSRVLHAVLGCTMPYPLWAHHEIREVHDEGDDYTVRRQGNARVYVLSRDTAHCVSLRQPTEIGGALRSVMIDALTAYRRQPGNEHLGTFEGMMRAAEMHEADSLRLRLALRDVPEGSR